MVTCLIRQLFLCPKDDLLIQVWRYIMLTKMFHIYLCWSSSYANENRSAADPVPLTMITGTFILIRLDTCSISHGLPWINKLTSGVLVLGIMWLSSGESSSEIFLLFHIMIMCELCWVKLQRDHLFYYKLVN